MLLKKWWKCNCRLQDPGAKNAASPKPPSGGGAFKNIDDDEVRIHFYEGDHDCNVILKRPDTKCLPHPGAGEPEQRV